MKDVERERDIYIYKPHIMPRSKAYVSAEILEMDIVQVGLS